jgi:hypothetical protein
MPFVINNVIIAYGLNDDVPEYDMDNEDDEWLKGFNKKKVSQRNPTTTCQNIHNSHYRISVELIINFCKQYMMVLLVGFNNVNKKTIHDTNLLMPRASQN